MRAFLGCPHTREENHLPYSGDVKDFKVLQNPFDLRGNNQKAGLLMRSIIYAIVILASLGFSITTFAAEAESGFSGTWNIDLRTRAERKQHVECGSAMFILTQTGNKITGDHSMAIAGCSRVNDGGEVKGIVVGLTAVLVVTSGRNGAIAMGTAKLRKGFLEWTTQEEIKPSETAGDSPLILGSGLLSRSANGADSAR